MLSSPLRRYRRLFVAIEYKRKRLRAVRRLTRASVPSSVRPRVSSNECVFARLAAAAVGWLASRVCVFFVSREREVSFGSARLDFETRRTRRAV